MDSPKILQLKLPFTWDDVHVWGNPLLKPPQSDARYLLQESDNVLKIVVSKEFSRTYGLWMQAKIQAKTDDTELLQVAAYELEAIKANITNVQDYISVRIGCSQQRVSLLLQLISLSRLQDEIPNFWYMGQSVPFISGDEEIFWKPQPSDIRKKKMAIKRICAGGWDGCKGDSTNGKLPLCLPCHTKASLEYGTMLYWPEWLLSEIKRIENEQYQAAKDACYKDHYGTCSTGELEYYLDAA